MKLTLRRTISGPSGTFGMLCGADPVCLTKEPVDPIIPAGTYKCTVYDSPKFGTKVFLLHDVPGHSYVELHYGNFLRDTKGCPLVGYGLSTSEGETIIAPPSKKCLNDLIKMHPKGFDLEVLDFRVVQPPVRPRLLDWFEGLFK